MNENRLTQDKALQRIGKIRSEIENAFARGSIDFDLIESELKSLGEEIGSNMDHAPTDDPNRLAPRVLLKAEDYR